MASGARIGAKKLTARDWLFGSRPRRLALKLVLAPGPPANGWTKTELAARCEVCANGGIDEHVLGLLALGVLEKKGGRYLPVKPHSALARRLASLVRGVEALPEVRIEELLEQRDGE